MAQDTQSETGAAKPRSPSLRPLIGAQLSTAGGFAPVPQRALAIGAEVVQIFSSNPRTWRAYSPSPQEVEALVTGLGRSGIPLYLHTIYLLNFASPDEALRSRSAEALATALAVGALTQAYGVVTHLGSHRGDGFDAALPRIQETVRLASDEAHRVLGDSYRKRGLPALLLENSAGSGFTVGGNLEELSSLLALLPSSCGLCLDTAHLFAAGYPLHTEVGLDQLVQELGERDLMRKVALIHLNDSKTPFASRRDQHENPGAGYLGRASLRRVVRHPAFAAVPFVLEVPGEKGHGPDAANVSLVKLMRRGAAGRRKRLAHGA